MANNDEFKWCGYTWSSKMDGGRIIHPSFPWYWYSLNTINVCEDGVLEFFIDKNPREVKYWDEKIYNPIFETPLIRSKEDFSYGTFTAEIIMPKGKNLSASFWLTGSGNWPPEIDIEEGWTEEKDSWFRWLVAQPPYIKPSWRTTTNVHYLDRNMNKCSIGSRNIPYLKQTKDPTENWIEYGCIWEPDRIRFYANGKEIRRVDSSICKNLTSNLKNPEKGYKMNAVFNVWVETEDESKVKMRSPMKIRNFKYIPYTIYYKP